MSDQLYIGDDGSVESQPLSWDGVPLYSPSTVREGLFDASAFEQMPGQTAMEQMIREDTERRIRREKRRRQALESCRLNVRSYFTREDNEFEREAYVQNLARLHGFEWWELEP